MYASPDSHAPAAETFRQLCVLIPQHWQSGDILAEDGTGLHYTRTGAGEGKTAIVLLHGIQALELMWLRVAEALEDQYDVIMPDFHAYGASGGTERGFSPSLLVSDTARLIEALQLDKPLIIGHSMGADIAARFAASHTVRGVVLVDPALQTFTPLTDAGMATPPWMEAIVAIMRALKNPLHEERLREGLKLLPPGAAITVEADDVSLIEDMARFDHSAYPFTGSMGYRFKEPETIGTSGSPVLLMTARPAFGMNIAAGLAVR